MNDILGLVWGILILGSLLMALRYLKVKTITILSFILIYSVTFISITKQVEFHYATCVGLIYLLITLRNNYFILRSAFIQFTRSYLSRTSS